MPTIFNQLSTISVLNADVDFFNYAATSAGNIAANSVVMVDTANTGTSQNPPGIVLATASPSTLGMPVGITLEAIAFQQRGRVRMLGASQCTADGALVYGQWVEASNTSAKLGRVRLATGAQPCIGFCLQQTAADGDPVLIFQIPGGRYVQTGSATLAAGTVTVSNVVLTANSQILVSRKTQGGTVTNTVQYEAPSASRNVGAGTMVLQASVAAGTANASDTSVVDYAILN
jgi:hypothetical protein